MPDESRRRNYLGGPMVTAVAPRGVLGGWFRSALGRLIARLAELATLGAVLLVGATGFGIVTPQSRFAAIAARTDSLDHRVAKLEQERAEDLLYLRALVTDLCLERPRASTQRLGIPCDRLLNSLPIGGELR